MGIKFGLPVVFNKPIDPVSDPDFKNRKTKPVTPAELGGYYLTSGLRHFQQKDGLIDLKILREDLDRWHNPNLKSGGTAPDLTHHNFGQVLWLNLGFLQAKNWKEALAEIRKRKLYLLDCWGIIPGLKEGIRGGAGWIIPEDVQHHITKHLGKYFLGWDNGENDGRWFWQVMRISPGVTDRKETYQYFSGWFRHFFSEYLQNYVNSLCGLPYPHYFAKMDGNRMIGAEFLQALPSVPMWASFVRGAARQYQVLWFAGISVFNFFGYKTFQEDVFYGDSKGKEWIGLGNPVCQAGPDRGHSLSMLRKTWYLLFVYGTNIESFEMSQLSENGQASPLGKIQLEATAFCRRNQKRRGVQYNPAAVLLDFYTGWAPPRHIYTDSFYVVWGGAPYEAGDHQIDLFFREIFPGYQDCPYFHDGKGFLTQTPYGDIVDVLLSDSRSEILLRYPVIWFLGEARVEGQSLEKLKAYAESGGRLIWSLNQLGEEAAKLSGLTALNKERKSSDILNQQTGKTRPEKPFTLPLVKLTGAKTILQTKNSLPVVVKKRVGKGEIITIIPPFGLCDRINEAHPLPGADPRYDTTTLHFFDKPIGSPYRFIEGVKDLLFPLLSELNLVAVEAFLDPFEKTGNPQRPAFVQYLTNLTESPKKILVTLVNNEPNIIYVRVKTKRAKIKKALDLLHGEKKMKMEKDGSLLLTLFPEDSADFNIYIIEIETDKPVVKFR